jgi:hypothetical protein
MTRITVFVKKLLNATVKASFLLVGSASGKLEKYRCVIIATDPSPEYRHKVLFEFYREG